MELPFTVVFEPPTRADLGGLVRGASGRHLWRVGAIGGLVLVSFGILLASCRADAPPAQGDTLLSLATHPAGAAVWLDGREQGRTPAQLMVAAGRHELLLRARDSLDLRRVIQVQPPGTRLDARLWTRQPTLLRLRPALPGASVLAARLLGDGRVGLSVGSGAEPQLQVWRFDPSSGQFELLATAPAAERVAIGADAEHIASIGREIGPWPHAGLERGPPAASVVWRLGAGQTAPVALWRSSDPGQRLEDITWSPRGDHFLVIGVDDHEAASGAVRSRVWGVRADGSEQRELLSLPSHIVPGAYAWSPDGQHVAFVAHAGTLNALCLLDLDGGFRYLADLAPSETPPLPYPPVAWSPDGQRLVFVAPRQPAASTALEWLQPGAATSLYEVVGEEVVPHLLAEIDADVPAWLSPADDETLVLLARLRNDGPLVVRTLDRAGQLDQLFELPLKVGSAYAAQWDVEHAQLLVATPGRSGSLEYWLVRLGAEDGP